MPQIRLIRIKNFRSIKDLRWFPCAGMNRLVGGGDTGKTTILDAIDLCLGARRSAAFLDNDFRNLNSSEPIEISMLLGHLEDDLKSIDAYGDFLTGFNAAEQSVEPEPGFGLETTLIVRLTVESDLEPQWSLVSPRAKAKGLQRNLKWQDRQNLAPMRLGNHPDWHLTWRRGAIFQKLSDENPELTQGLSGAARTARENFGTTADTQLKETLDTVQIAADELGVRTNGGVAALLDANSVNFGSGAISLHSKNGVPLSSLGTGSKGLLIAGLARRTANSSTISLVDEIETGLEPHRIRSLLNTLGAKEHTSSKQVFATSHSPVVLRELRHDQLAILRHKNDSLKQEAFSAGEDAQGILRATPEAFLAQRVLICEGKSEVGYLRGFDQNSVSVNGGVSFEALGTVLVDGGGVDRLLSPAEEFQRLGYSVAIFMNSDVPLDPTREHKFTSAGARVFKWPNSWALENAIFENADLRTLSLLIEYAVLLHGDGKVQAQISSASLNTLSLEAARAKILAGELTADEAKLLGVAAKSGKGWFKLIEPYEHVAREILAPNWGNLQPTLTSTTSEVLNWMWGQSG